MFVRLLSTLGALAATVATLVAATPIATNAEIRLALHGADGTEAALGKS